MKKTILLTASMFLFLAAASLHAEQTKLTIIHTNDLHSHILGFAPNLDYTSEVGDDATRGGFARIATEIRQIRSVKKNPVIVIDAGDFLMGTLFHMPSREEALELQLMRDMGYDIIGLGNHEFDLKPRGLARILTAATSKGKMPTFLLSNIVFSKDSDKDDTLENVFKQGIVRPYTVMTKGDLRIGLFALMGKDAAEVAPFASPVTFSDQVETAKKMVALLRDREKVRMVVAVSHSGLVKNPDKSEDRILARKVPGIDVIVSGHTHTLLTEPIVENGVIIVQSGHYGKNLGVLDLSFRNGAASVDRYESIVIDDSIPSDAAMEKKIRSFIGLIDRKVLREHGLSFYQTIMKTDFDLTIVEDESNLGNLISDSIRWYVNKYDSDPKDASTRVAVAVESFGLIRDDILKGKTGKIALTDLFNSFPLGIGSDDTMGYPIVSFYMNGPELKKALEVLTSIYPLKGSDYFLQISGIKFNYNPNRMIFDRVTGIWLQDGKGEYRPLDYSASNKTLYRVAANIYNSTFLKIIGSFTMNILNIVPKDKLGNPISDLDKALVDADPAREGVQELKEWIALVSYCKSFPDTDGDGIPDVPEEYRLKQGRVVAQASWNPVALLSGGNALTWGAFGMLILLLVIAALAGYGIHSAVKRLRAR